MNSLIEKWREKFAATSDNETGAETIEIIVFLAIFVLGMVVVWIGIRRAASDKGGEIEDCLDSANTGSGSGGSSNC